MSKLTNVKISQCMIVKNEEKNIERALSWGKDIMCQQIVVDTGSTDKTVELAKKMGAEVYYFEWINDFAAAKNYAIEKATGDWIAFLDADEYMSREDAQLINKYICNYMSDEYKDNPPDALTCKLIDIGSDDSISNIASQNRFFRNNGVHYNGKVHEAISKEGPFLIKELDDVKIFHTGYQKENIISQKKGKRNVEMIERELEEDPDSYLMKSYLVDSLLLYITEAEAIEDKELATDLRKRTKEVTQECMEHLDESSWPYQRKTALAKVYFINVLSLDADDFEEKVTWGYEICQKVMPQNGDIDYFLGTLFYNRKQYEQTIVYYERALRKLKQSGVEETDNNGHLKTSLGLVYYILSAIYFNQNVNSQALKYIILALQMDKFNVDKLMVLLKIVMEQRGIVVEDELERLFEKIYDYTHVKDKIFIYSIANKFGFENIAKNIFSKLNDEEKTLLR